MKQVSASFSIYFMIILPLSLCTSPWFYISSTKCILTSLLPHSPKQVLFSDCHICSLYTYVSFIGLQNLYLLNCWIFLNENLCVDYEFSLWKILQLLRIFFCISTSISLCFISLQTSDIFPNFLYYSSLMTIYKNKIIFKMSMKRNV